MKIRHWIIISVVAGLAGWAGIFFVVKTAFPVFPRLPELVGPIEPDSELGKLLGEGHAAEETKDYLRAIELYSKAIEDQKTPGLIRREFLRRRAFARESAEQYKQAEADYNAALKIEPLDPDLYARRGFFLMRRKRYDEALVDFTKGARLDLKKDFYAFGEGLVYDERGEYKRAIERFSEALRMDPGIRNYYVSRGSAYNSVKMFNNAYADYDKALQIEFPAWTPRETARVHLGRGFASLNLKDYQHAKNDFDLVLEIMPRSSNALGWRGSAYKGLGQKDLALADYKAALALDPDNKQAAYHLNRLEAATDGVSR